LLQPGKVNRPLLAATGRRPTSGPIWTKYVTGWSARSRSSVISPTACIRLCRVHPQRGSSVLRREAQRQRDQYRSQAQPTESAALTASSARSAGNGEAFDVETRLPQTMARQILDVSCHCRVTHNGTIRLGVTKIPKVRTSACKCDVKLTRAPVDAGLGQVSGGSDAGWSRIASASSRRLEIPSFS
jgi:hypothetical protein